MEENQKAILKQEGLICELSTVLGDLSKKELRFDKSTIEDINGLKTALNSISVPSEVKLSKTVSFSDITKKVLLWFFVSSSLIIGIALYIGIKGIEIKQSEDTVMLKGRVFTKEQLEWLYDYSADMAKKNPKTHETYLKEHPIPLPK